MSKEQKAIPDHRNPDYKGEELPDDLADGPLENRRCTDILCCLIFLAFLIAWVICGFYGFSNGNPALLTHPFDMANNQCGLSGTNASSYPYLYFPFPFPGEIDYRLCLKNCPSTGDNTTECLVNSQITNCSFYWSEFSNSSTYTATTRGIYNARGYLDRFCLPKGNLTLCSSTTNSNGTISTTCTNKTETELITNFFVNYI